MERNVHVAKPKLHLTVDSPGTISVRDSQDEYQQVPKSRRRTTSFKARRPCEQRRHSLPLYNKYNAKPKSTKKNMFQRMGSRLAKVGDDLVKTRGRRLGKSTAPQQNGVSRDKNCLSQQGEKADIERYAAKLAEIGDYLESLYSSDGSKIYSSNRYATLGANCSLLTTILVALRNQNVVVVRESDLETLSAFCRIHRVKSISRKDR